MGMIECPKHGNQGLSLVSPKIAEYILNKIPFDFGTEQLLLEIDTGLKSIHPIDETFAETLRKRYGLKEKLEVSDNEEAFEVLSELKPVCEVCLNDSSFV
ncbi:MAG TPA: hypothetical protein VEC37_02385 [Bacillota bacterium]|nr:hypothetical protein [Bacillota bacterium]